MTTSHSKIITAENLVAGYEGNIVWQDANFDIDQGEFVAIIGPNGAGKTTLLRLLLGLQQPISGTIKIFDAQPKRGNSQIGYVPQRHVIDSETTIESLELVRLGFSGNDGVLAYFPKTTTKQLLMHWKLLEQQSLHTVHSMYCQVENCREYF